MKNAPSTLSELEQALKRSDRIANYVVVAVLLSGALLLVASAVGSHRKCDYLWRVAQTHADSVTTAQTCGAP